MQGLVFWVVLGVRWVVHGGIWRYGSGVLGGIWVDIGVSLIAAVSGRTLTIS